jgi:hypothetical protein
LIIKFSELKFEFPPRSDTKTDLSKIRKKMRSPHLGPRAGAKLEGTGGFPPPGFGDSKCKILLNMTPTLLQKCRSHSTFTIFDAIIVSALVSIANKMFTGTNKLD